ncbi:helix-turn-helix domain-containing protein [Aeromonas caviae]
MKILHYSIVLYLDLAHVMTPSNREGEILTIREVAEYLKITERTVYRLAAAKQIPAFKVGGAWRFRIVDIDSWIAAQLKTAGGTD